MSMSMLNAIGSANQSISQFMFLGSNEWALADCATLNLLASGTTSVDLAAGVTGGFAAPGVFLGLSGPSSVGGDAFAFQINANTGAFTTYELPSDFPYFTSLAGVPTNTAVSSDTLNVYVTASTPDLGAVTLLNLSQICGLVSGSSALGSIDGGYGVTNQFVVAGGVIYGVGEYAGNTEITAHNLSTFASTGVTFGNFSSMSGVYFGAIGMYLFLAHSLSEIDLINASTGEVKYTIQSSSMISVENAFAFGDNLFLLNYTNNQAQSVNLANPASPQFSPVFPLDLSSSGTAPGFSWMDPSTGVYYQNVSGASTFANLSPMQF